jgi:hypothetical protein
MSLLLVSLLALLGCEKPPPAPAGLKQENPEADRGLEG